MNRELRIVSKSIKTLDEKIKKVHIELSTHPIYQELYNIQNIQTFMEHHIFAVWDFMTIVKSLQIKLSCTSLPWKPSSHSKNIVRFINSIVLDEESDLDQNGEACDHFSLYLRAMDEVEANTRPCRAFLQNFDVQSLSHDCLRDFVQFNIDTSHQNSTHIIAGVFCYGREKIIPEMFSTMLREIEGYTWFEKAPSLAHYLKRHIELDGDEHGPLAEELLAETCGNNPKRYQEALSAGLQACLLRKRLYDHIQSCIISSAKLKDNSAELA